MKAGETPTPPHTPWGQCLYKLGPAPQHKHLKSKPQLYHSMLAHTAQTPIRFPPVKTPNTRGLASSRQCPTAEAFPARGKGRESQPARGLRPHLQTPAHQTCPSAQAAWVTPPSGLVLSFPSGFLKGMCCLSPWALRSSKTRRASHWGF